MDEAAQSESTSSAIGEPLVDSLLFELIELSPDERPGAMAAMCVQYPWVAEVLRRRVGLLEAQLPLAMASDIEATFGPFQLVRRLGAGMAEVFLAVDSRSASEVVIKILRHPELLEPQTKCSFEREAVAASRLSHPCIGPVLEIGVVDGTPYLVQPYVPGVSLAEWIQRRRARKLPLGPADIELVLGWLEEILRALHVAHQVGLVHRDVKPANILIPFHGRPRLLDFGLSQEIEDSSASGSSIPIAGTLAYMAPELLSPDRRPCLPSSDVFAAGVTLFECLALRLPFSGETRQAMCRAILLQDPPDLRRHLRRLPPGLEKVVAGALAKSVGERYASAAAFADDLARLRRGERVQPPRGRRRTRIRRLLALHGQNVQPIGIVGFLLVAALVAIQISGVGKGGDVDLLVIPERLRDAEARAAALVPGWPEQIPGLSNWLVVDGEPLAALLPRLRERVSRLVLDPGSEPAVAWTLQTALPRLEQFAAGERGAMAVVRSRLSWARQVIARTVDAHAAAWRDTTAAVAADPLYRGLRLVPQLDLIPLGRDPESHLFEFYHPLSAWTGAPLVHRDPDRGHVDLHDGAGMVFVLIPSCSFVMGEQSNDPSAPRYDPEAGEFSEPGTVELDAFFISKYEMTQAQWEQLTGELPSYYRIGSRCGGDPPVGHRHPVDSVSAMQCDEALRCIGLRLPTEAQWEYACGTGSASKWFFGDDPLPIRSYANIGGVRDGNTGTEDKHIGPARVGSYLPNPFGLYDVLGNVSEWCLDVWGPYTNSPPAPGDGLRFGEPGRNRQRSLRGGSHKDATLHRNKTAHRLLDLPDRRDDRFGLRPARPVHEGRG